MLNLFKSINRKLKGMMWTFIGTGILLALLGVLMVWTDLVLKLVMGLITIVIAYMFLYIGLKLHHIKKEIEDFTE